MKTNILDLTRKELSLRLNPPFRAKQIYQWIYQKYVFDFDLMNNLPKKLRSELKESFRIYLPKIVSTEKSRDGSVKYLFELEDGHTVESVLLPMRSEQRDERGNLLKEARYTVCVSTQVGCKVGCSFCLTAKGGFVRNLTSGEIVSQVLSIKAANNIASNRRVNVVYMGMGEPLDNLDNLSKAIEIFADENGLSIGARRQTVSTSGLAPKIEKLGKMNTGVLLAISLHAVDDELREKLMPINKAYNIADIIEAVKRFPIDQRKRVMFEYLMIRNLNDSLDSAKKLVKLLNGIKAKVNLILFNPYPGSPFERPEAERVERFQKFLLSKGLLCTVRESKGLDISAACGQLREKRRDDGYSV